MTKTEKMLTQMETLVASGMIDKSASASAEIAARALSLEKANLDAQISAASASYMKFFGTVPKNLSTPPSLLNSRRSCPHPTQLEPRPNYGADSRSSFSR